MRHAIDAMSETKTRTARSSSRTIVIAVVVLLVIVAIAGIVLAGRQGNAAGDAAGDPATGAVKPDAQTQAAATPPAASVPAESNPNEVRFAPGSDKLPPGANESIARFADAARASGNGVRLSTRFLTGENKARDFELAKARVASVRHALQADGIGPEKMQSELIEVPAGALDAAAADRVDLIVR